MVGFEYCNFGIRMSRVTSHLHFNIHMRGPQTCINIGETWEDYVQYCCLWSSFFWGRSKGHQRGQGSPNRGSLHLVAVDSGTATWQRQWTHPLAIQCWKAISIPGIMVPKWCDCPSHQWAASCITVQFHEWKFPEIVVPPIAGCFTRGNPWKSHEHGWLGVSPFLETPKYWYENSEGTLLHHPGCRENEAQMPIGISLISWSLPLVWLRLGWDWGWSIGTTNCPNGSALQTKSLSVWFSSIWLEKLVHSLGYHGVVWLHDRSAYICNGFADVGKLACRCLQTFFCLSMCYQKHHGWVTLQ